MDTDRVIKALDEIYGPGKGLDIYMTIMPGILADFDRMLSKANAGERVREQYNLEDGRGVILVTGNLIEVGSPM